MTSLIPLSAEVMSGSAAVMDPSSPLRLMLFLFLFVSPNIICLHGYSPTDVDHSFHCTNDYLSTINCSLGITSSEIPSDTNSSYWLYLQKECEKEEGIEGAVCMLTNTNEDDFCAVNTADGRAQHMYCPHPFVNTDSITISLCHNQSDGSKSCIVLDEMYEPVKNIKPNTPCCLAVSQNASQHNFTWKSTYEEFSSTSTLNKNLMYQLNYYKRGDKQNAFHEINTDNVWFSTDDNNFVPNTEYAARVRSSPNGDYFNGEWSSWSSEVHWTTDSVSSNVDRSFHCTNDYLSTVNCSLGITSSKIPSDTNSSYWLYLQKECEKDEGIEGAVCMLTNTNEDDFCAVNTADGRAEHMYCPHPFVDTDSITISLCHNQSDGSKSCIVLDEIYEPMENIKPNAPCCLAVSQNASQHNFTWKSTYEKFSSTSTLNKNLMYQLNYYKRGDKQKAVHDINRDDVWFSTDDNNFVPNTEYAARVRSSPNRDYFNGEWSSWSSEVHWTTDTGPSVSSVSSNITPLPFVYGLGMKMIIPLFVIVPLIVLLCYAPIKKWRQSNFIPTPAPYFQTLYSDCHGDFKSWVVTHENTTDMLKAEQTPFDTIDTLIKYAYVQEEDSPSDFQQNVMKGSTYENIINSDCDSSLLGIPYAVSTMAPMSASGSPLTSCTLSLQSGSPAEGDSGCWLCSEYCTLSAFQHSCSVPVEYSGKPPMKSCSTEMIRVDAIAEV